jgi:hypothetical protein
MPNLVITSAGPGQYRITNASLAPAGNFKVRVTYEYGGSWTEYQVNGLAPFAVTTAAVGPWCGGYTVQADSRGRVSEGNESDNSLHVDLLTGCI